jgi:hypothetical protein
LAGWIGTSTTTACHDSGSGCSEQCKFPLDGLHLSPLCMTCFDLLKRPIEKERSFFCRPS